MEAHSDRAEAGGALAHALARLDVQRPVVVALPPGAVPIASRMALDLRVPLDVLVVTRLGAPGRPDLALGALAEDGACLVNEPLATILGVGEREIARLRADARAQLASEVALWRHRRVPLAVGRRQVVLVDDGILTGASSVIAARSLRRAGASRVVLASPQTTAEGLEAVRVEVDDLVVLQDPRPIEDVDALFEGRRVTEDEAIEILDRHDAMVRAALPRAASG